VLDHVNELFRHAEWADAENYRALLACKAATEDAGNRARLHHVHLVQHLYLQLWRGRTPEATEAADYSSLTALRIYGRMVHELTGVFLAELTEARLEEPVFVPWFKDAGFRPSLRQTLHQVVEHGAYHRGQAASRLRDLGGDPPTTDYIVWLWQGRPPARW
jgi:uncharacterized damage-inducible protein DinB